MCFGKEAILEKGKELKDKIDKKGSYDFEALKIFYTYEWPDGGTYQLEELLDKELAILNDFEYDAEAKNWMS